LEIKYHDSERGRCGASCHRKVIAKKKPSHATHNAQLGNGAQKILCLVRECKRVWGLTDGSYRVAVELNSNEGTPDYTLQRKLDCSTSGEKWVSVHAFDLKTKDTRLYRGEKVQTWLAPRHWRDKLRFEKTFGEGFYKGTVGYYLDQKGKPHWARNTTDVPEGWTPGKRFNRSKKK
jgi:hypothetical protein